MTQSEKILFYLNNHESISPMEAFHELGITKLATRISEMKKDGIEFEQERIKSQNACGEPVTYMRYKLKTE